jgi:hypothetical protein
MRQGRLKPKHLAGIVSQLKSMPTTDGGDAAQAYTPVASLKEGINGGKASRVTVVQVIVVILAHCTVHDPMLTRGDALKNHH